MLNRDVKQFGKKFMFDSNEETCWNSDQVKPQQCPHALRQAEGIVCTRNKNVTVE